MKQIVIKMRSMKKLFGDDLLQLALLLSLMKVRAIVLVAWPPQLQETKKVQNKNKCKEKNQVQNLNNLVLLFEPHMSANKRI